jgi:membrane protein required for colicin V production
MHLIDIFIAVPLLWGFYKGITRGFVFEISTLAGLLLATFAAVKFTDFLSNYLRTEHGWESEYLPHAVFSMLFILVLILVYLLAKLLTHVLGKIKLGWANKLAGAAIGTLKFAFIVSAILFVLNAVNEKAPFLPDDLSEKSLLYKPISFLSEWMLKSYDSFHFEEIIKELESKAISE